MRRVFVFMLLILIFAGNASAAVIIFNDGFETGTLNSWNLSAVAGANNWTNSITDPFQGTRHAQSQPQSTTEPASVLEINVSTLSYQNINFSYHKKLIGLDAADEFQAEWFDGTSWILLDSIGSNSVDNTVYNFTSFLLPSTANNNANLKIKFECTAGAVSEFCRVDNVNVTGDAVGGGDTTAPLITINSPLNSTLNISTPILNVTVIEPNIDTVWISIDNKTNITYAHKNGTIDFGKLDLIFADDFQWYQNNSNGTPIWTNPLSFGTARVVDGAYRLFNETAIDDALAYISNFNATDYYGSSKVMVPNGSFGGAYLIPRFNDVNNKYEIALDYDFSSININKVVNGNWTNLAALWTGNLPTPVFVSKGEWHTLGFSVLGTNISAYVDGQLALSVLDSSLNYSGFAIIAFDDVNTHTAYFDDVEIHKELSYGSHNLVVYANDSSGNINSTQVGFFVNVTDGGDNEYPKFNNFVESPANGTAYSSGAIYNFNSTITSTNGSIRIEFNGVNYTATNLSSVFNFSIGNLAAGTYSYYWHGFGNGSSNNYNASSLRYYTISKDAGNVSLLLNNLSANLTIPYLQQTNASTSTLYGTSTLYRDGMDVTSQNGINITLGAGSYNYTAVSSGNQNYSSATITRWVHITQATPSLTYYLNGVANNLSVVYPMQVNASGSINAGTLQIFRDGISIVNSQNYTLGVGYYRFDYNITGNQNYSNFSAVLFANVTQTTQSITPLLNGNNANLVINYPQQINASYSGANQTAVSINVNETSVNIGQNYTFGVGGYVVNYSALGNQNYSVFSGLLNLTINKANSEVNLTLNGTEGNITIVQGSSILLNGTLITGDNSTRILLYNNGSLINNNTNEASNLTNFTQAGLFNISVFYEGTQNYSQSFETYFVNVTASASSSGNNSAPVINYNYTVVNSTAKTPIFGENFFIQANVSDPENNTVNVGFTIIAPNGTRVLDNVLGSSFSYGNYSIWNSTNYIVNDYGYWNWSVLASDGVNSTQSNGSFRVLADLSIFPAEYIVTPDPKNQTLIWNLSMYHNSLENYNFTFGYTLNTTFFNLSFTNGSAILSKVVYNDTNLFKNQIMINISNSVIEGVVYDGNVTIQRILDGKNYTVPLKIGVNPPSGDADALDTPSLSVCSDGSCDVDTTMENDENKNFNWTIKNTGNFTLTNCKPAINGFSIANFGTFNLNNFELGISESKSLVLTISQPPINSYYGKLEVICQATVLGFNDSLGADTGNVPGLRLIVTADSGGGTTPVTPGGTPTSGGGTTGQVIRDRFELSAETLEKLEIGRGESEAIALTVRNTGNKFLNGCYLSADEGVFSWVSTNQIESLSPGQEMNYIFTVSTPIDSEEGDYFTNLNIVCKETSLTQRYNISVVAGEFEIILLSSERDGTKLLVNYAAESFADEEKEISIHYELIDSKQKGVAEGEVDKFALGARERIEKSFEFELPKNSVGDYRLIVQASDGINTNRYEQAVRLTSKGLTGFAISDANLRALSWFGVIILVCLGIYLAVKMIRRQIILKREGKSAERQFIKIDLKD